MTTNNPSLVMMRRGFANLPAIEPPPGYHLRPFVDGDLPNWLQIVRAAFDDPTWNEDRFRLFMVDHVGFAMDRIYFVCDPEGRACATASAFRTDDDRVGYVHYVAADPAYAGRRLGYLATLGVLHRFREDGLRSAMLETTDHRMAAIKTYLRLGFRPMMVAPGQPERWRVVLDQVKEGANERNLRSR